MSLRLNFCRSVPPEFLRSFFTLFFLCRISSIYFNAIHIGKDVGMNGRDGCRIVILAYSAPCLTFLNLARGGQTPPPPTPPPPPLKPQPQILFTRQQPDNTVFVSTTKNISEVTNPLVLTKSNPRRSKIININSTLK